MNSIHFVPEAPNVRHAIAASFDMSGFSSFCRRPDAHAYLTRYLSTLFKTFDNAFKDWLRDFFKETTGLIQVPRPDFAKYTGDGALLLWIRDTGNEFSNEFCSSVVAALRHFQQQLPIHVAKWESHWRTNDLPKKARFGIATGPVQPLASTQKTIMPEVVDYAGYCINLAVRLQDHCPSVGFIVHQPVQPRLPGLIQVQAKKMKGTLIEPVYVFESDFNPFRSSAPKEAKAKFNIP